jgi:hypothetical protein
LEITETNAKSKMSRKIAVPEEWRNLHLYTKKSVLLKTVNLFDLQFFWFSDII